MATGIATSNATPVTYTGKDGVLFHLKDDMSVFLSLTATTDVSYTSPMEVTTQPVQTGQTVTDNVQEKPNTIRIEGVVVVGYQGSFLLSLNTSVVEDFITTLSRWRTQRQVLTVLCQDGIGLTTAFCTNFEAKKDASISNGLKITLEFQDVNFVIQVGQTQSATTANGSSGAKTKTGAVTAKKEVGKSGSDTIMPSNCANIFKIQRAGLVTDSYSYIPAAVAGCRATYLNKSSTGYNEVLGQKYVPKNALGSQGGNVNIQGK